MNSRGLWLASAAVGALLACAPTAAWAECGPDGVGVILCTGTFAIAPHNAAATYPTTTTLNVNNLGADITPDSGKAGVSLLGIQPRGADGDDASGLESGDSAPAASNGANLTATHIGGARSILTTGDSAHGIVVISRGGDGGTGGDGQGVKVHGGDGGTGGTGGSVTVNSSGVIQTGTGSGGNNAHGILAQSIGGNGGNGGDADAVDAEGGNGGSAAGGGTVIVNSSSQITTYGSSSHGIFAESIGGRGGNGGDGDGISGDGGSGGTTAPGGHVKVDNSGTITVHGADSYGILAQSVGGYGGAGGDGSGIVGYGSSGASAGNGGLVEVSNSGAINTNTAVGAHAIFAQSVGGGGGAGGSGAGIAGLGAGGSTGGAGGEVIVITTGTATLHTGGTAAMGILAQSIGGGGGDGGSGSGIAGIGGTGSATSAGGKVTVTNTQGINTEGDRSNAIFAQSVGGGGGNGGTGGGIIAIGGKGGGGGAGDRVIVNNSGILETAGANSSGIFAQSVGGGGGNGGGAFSGGVDFSIAIGGAGAVGGAGGEVIVNQTLVAGDLSGLDPASITTGGAKAYGILAQSVGGGGGNGGMAVAVAVNQTTSVAVALGGSAGPGGTSGAVTVNYKGDIDTSGILSSGIFAQSVGGGGGDGGGSVSVAGGGGMALSFAMGGKAGVGGDGADVKVNADGTITTVGALAHGIHAQSVGGGGGNGGFAGGGAMAGASMSIGLGGKGAGGGDGKDVTVNNHATITTEGDGAFGVNAQSIGGGGGNGGYAVTGTIGVGTISAAIGGDGAGGGDGGIVTVDNQGGIETHGVKAYGIFAQSVGKGGGNGGFAVSFGVAVAPPDLPAVSLTAAVGGNGAGGGLGSDVNVTSGGNIETFGREAHAIYAQSVGGGGGNGGFAGSGAAAIGSGANMTIAVGGKGGTGNYAGDVTVDAGKDSAGNVIDGTTIFTHASGANGIRAQAIGGGGGDGGLAIAVGFGANTGESLQMGVAVAVGGRGGAGGDGGVVEVNNWSDIRTLGDNAVGIFAQSAGGGGGDGGNAITALVGIANTTKPDARTVNVSVAIGGGAGSAGDGRDVTVDNHGRIETGLDTWVVHDGDKVVSGASAYGIFAQSIGKGGGIGGRANSINVLVGKGCGEECPEDGKTNIALSAAVGGDGGGGGNGGTVRVTNSGDIITHGATADGIYAQSVGGGGGNGGNGILGTGELIPVPVALLANVAFGKTKIYSSLGVAVGGTGGSSGQGGLVEVTNTGSITTEGGNSNGIFAQSVGGGGGVGGVGNIGATGTVGIGGRGTSAGDGGVVNVHNLGNGVIETFGRASNGIFAQSIGGGGGVAGNVDRVMEKPLGPLPKLNVGIGLAFGQGGGGGGDGEAVTVESNGIIRTHGVGAFGIFAQSVGGGGGVLGNLGNDVPLLGDVTNYFIGSNGDVGKSGIVTVTHAGAIETFGDNATGIFAQSAGGKESLTVLGKGIAENVTVNLTGSVTTNALGTSAIVAQSVGEVSSGNVAINLNSTSGIVRGGASDANHTGVGVWILDGKDNTVLNRGTVTTASGVAGGFAMLSGDANEAVQNYGTITGSFDLGAGANSFTNYAGGVINSGTIAMLGAAATLVDQGYLSPGGTGRVMTTELTGNWDQSATGTYRVDLDLSQIDIPGLEADLVNVSGRADLLGSVNVGIINAGGALPGTHEVVIVHANGDLTDATPNALQLTAPASAVAKYELIYPTDQDVALRYTIDFAPVGLNRNQTALARHVNDIMLALPRPASGSPATSAIAPAIAALFSLPDIGSLALGYDRLNPTVYAENKLASLYSGIDFSNALLSCRVLNGPNRFIEEGNCAWIRAEGRGMSRDLTDENRAFNAHAAGFSLGVQRAVADRFTVGFGLSRLGTHLVTDLDASSDGTLSQAGVVVKGRFGATTLSAAATGGYGSFDATRVVDFNGLNETVQGKQNLGFAGLHLRAAHLLGGNSLYLRPAVDFRAVHQRMDGFEETGSGVVGMSIFADAQTYFTTGASIEVGGEFTMGDIKARPFARLGVTQFLGDDPEVTALFQQAPSGLPSFMVNDVFSKTSGEVAIGIDMIAANGAVVRLDGFYQRSGDVTGYGANLKMSVPIH